MELGFVEPRLVGVELAWPAGVELHVEPLPLLVDVGGRVELVLADLVSHDELGVGDAGPHSLLLPPGGVDGGEGLLVVVSGLQLQVDLGEVSLSDGHPDEDILTRLD